MTKSGVEGRSRIRHSNPWNYARRRWNWGYRGRRWSSLNIIIKRVGLCDRFVGTIGVGVMRLYHHVPVEGIAPDSIFLAAAQENEEGYQKAEEENPTDHTAHNGWQVNALALGRANRRRSAGRRRTNRRVQ